jgi:exosortase A
MTQQVEVNSGIHAGDTAADPAWMPALAWFAGLSALLLALFHNVAAAMAYTWWTNVTYNHGFFVLPVSLWLIWLRRGELKRLTPRQEPLALAALVAMGCGWLIGRAGDVLAVEEVAWVGMLIALFVFVFGRDVSRRLVFPLAFLFFMVPVGDALIEPLQDFTARFAVELLRRSGIPVFHDGIMIQIPNGLYEVAEACAGIRFLIANVVISALFAHLAYQKRWKFWLFLGIGALLPIIANGFRAYGIILLGYWSNGKLAAGIDHLIYGWLFFSIVMILLLLIGNSFADRRLGDFPQAAAGTRNAPARGWPWRSRTAVLAALVLAAGPAYAWTVMAPPAMTASGAALPPPVLSEWSPVPASDWRPSFPGADSTLLGGFESSGRRVELFAAYYRHQRQAAEVVYHANRLDGGGWSRVESRTLDDVPGMPPAQLDRLVRGSRQRLVLSWYWVGGRFTASPYQAKLYQSIATLFGIRPAAAAVALSVERLEDASAFLDEVALDPWLEGLSE